ncbi:MAG: cellulose synthase subunit BcsC-related outer membrane protein [Thiotrichales bacterium]
MSRTGKNKIRCLLLALALSSSQAPAETPIDPDITQLLVQGHYWVDQGRYDLARNAWEKVLRVQPANSEASFGISDLDALHPELIDHEELLRARKLARAGRYTEALAAYRAAFRGYQPGALLSAEYLETLSGTFNGWDPAVADLRKLTERYPSSQRYQLIYHRVLSYRERGRREAILGLQALVDKKNTLPDIRKKAQEALRNALLWLSPKPADKVLYDRYLAQNPDDEEVRAHQQKADLEHNDTLKSSWALLDRGEYAAAAIGFESALNQEELRASALFGLGLSRLAQHRFSEAAYLLGQARKINPDLDVEEPLSDARFWSRFHATRHAQQNGKLNYALKQAERLVSERPALSEPHILLGSIYHDLARYDAAIMAYEQALHLNEQDPAARDGLLKSLVYLEDGKKAQQLVERFGLSQTAFQTARNYRLADELYSKALESQEIQPAISMLEQALQLAPQRTWARLELARLQRIANGIEAANLVFASAPANLSNNPEFLYALSSFEAENGDIQNSQKTLSRIGAKQMSFEMKQLAAENALMLQWRKLRQLLRVGDREAAQKILPPPDSMIASPPSQRLIYAEMLAELGHRAEADEIAGSALSATGENQFKHGLLYANYLIRRGEPAQAEDVAATLKKLEGLTLAQQHFLHDLDQRLLFAQSWAAVEHEDYPAALAYLAELEEPMEQREDVLMLKGLLLSQQEQWKQSLEAYEAVIAQNPHNLGAVSAAYGLNLKFGHTRAAAELLENSLQENPNAGLLHAYRGQIEEIRGERLRARLSFQRALKLYESQEMAGNAPDITPSSAQQPLTPPSWVGKTRVKLDQLALESTDWVSAAFQVRNREGENGVDALDEYTLPLSWKNYLNNGQVLTARIKPVSLKSGRYEPNAGSTAWGSFPLSPNQLSTVAATEEEGIALSLGIEADRWGVTLGTTPLGFENSELVGALTWRNSDLQNQLSLTLERDAIKESVLAYAGYSDPLTGIRWGQVTRTGIRADLNWPQGRTGWFGRLAGYQYSGQEVADNDQLEVLAGYYRNEVHLAHPRIDTGISFRYTRYDNDQNHYTVGHGGYFSPQQYYSASIPVTLTESRGRVQLGLSGNFGYQYYETDDSLVFPAHLNLQTSLDNSAGLTSVFIGDSVNGITYSFQARVAYHFDSDIQIGAWIASQHSENYSETGAGVFLRYSLFDGKRDKNLFRKIDSELLEEQW